MSPPVDLTSLGEFDFLNDQHEKLFKSFPKRKQELMIKMADGDPDRMHRMLWGQLAKALNK
jgi:hypothetical protein